MKHFFDLVASNIGKSTLGFRRLRLIGLFGAVIAGLFLASACAGGTDFEDVTLTADLQPDPATLVVDDTDGDGKPSPGEAFSVLAGLYNPGTDQKIGDFICRGVFLADITIVALDQAPEISGGVSGQFSSVDQVYTFDGRGQVNVTGTEPGTDGGAGLARPVTGGTGEFKNALGNLTFQPALGASLSPAFRAPAVADTAITFLSGRVTFALQIPEE